MQSSCNATGTRAAGCIFNDITLGTNAMPCIAGTLECTTTAGNTTGILSVPSATPGYDLASGLGSVNAYNLVESFTTVKLNTPTAILSLTPSSVVHGQPVTTTVSVAGPSAFPTGEVAISAQAASGSVGFGPLVNGTYTQTFRNFPGGTYGVQAHYAGDTTYGAVDSNFVSLTVTPEPSTITLETLDYDPVTRTAAAVAAAPYGDIWYIRAAVAGQSGQGTATGNVTVQDAGRQLRAGVFRLNSSGSTEDQNDALTPGTHLFSATYQGDSSFQSSTATPVLLTITKGLTSASVTLGTTNVSQDASITLSAIISTTSFGYLPPTGTITFYSGATVVGTAVLAADTNAFTYQQQGTAAVTLSAKALPLGFNAITVAYPGDSNYLPSASPATSIQVTSPTLIPTSTFVFPTPYSVAPNASILYTAIITPGSPSPTGKVQFAVDGRDVGITQVVVAGGFSALQTTVAGLAVGFHTLTGTYSGDTRYSSSTSAPSSFLITTAGAPSSLTFTANPTNVTRGTFVSVPVTVTPANPSASAPTPTGTVQLVLDGSLYPGAFPLTHGADTLSLPTANLQVGTHILDVFYSGSSTYGSIYGNPINLTLTAAGATPSILALTNLPPTIAIGSAPTFTATVTPLHPTIGDPTPTGVLEVTYDHGTPGAPILLTGVANQLILPASLPLGPHTVSVFYSGDNLYNFFTSATQTFTIVVPHFMLTPAAFSDTVSNLDGNPSTYRLTLTPNTAFSFPVTLACSGLPANTACNFSPADVTFSGISPLTSILTVDLDTGVPGVYTSNAGPSHVQPSALWTSLLQPAGLLCLAIPLAFAGRRNRRIRLAAALLVLGILTTLNGCGSGYKDLAGMTPAGTYAITITATSPYETHTSTLTLTVRQQ